MSSAFTLVEVYAFPDSLTCLTYSEEFVFVGTAAGDVHRVTVRVEYDVTDHRLVKVGKRVTQIEAIPDLGYLLVLVDGGMKVLDMGDLSSKASNLDTRNVTSFVLSMRAHPRYCVGIVCKGGKKVKVFEVGSEGKYAASNELDTPEAMAAVAYNTPRVYMGYSREYNICEDTSGAVSDSVELRVGSNNKAFLRCLPGGRVLMTTSDCTGVITDASGHRLGEADLRFRHASLRGLALCYPYTISIGSDARGNAEARMEVHAPRGSGGRDELVQELTAPGPITAIHDGRMGYTFRTSIESESGGRGRNAVYIACDRVVLRLQPVPVQQQVVEMVKGFHIAAATDLLVGTCTDTSTLAERLNRLHIDAGRMLFLGLHFEAAFHHLTLSSLDPRELIPIYQHTLASAEMAKAVNEVAAAALAAEEAVAAYGKRGATGAGSGLAAAGKAATASSLTPTVPRDVLVRAYCYPARYMGYTATSSVGAGFAPPNDIVGEDFDNHAAAAADLDSYDTKLLVTDVPTGKSLVPCARPIGATLDTLIASQLKGFTARPYVETPPPASFNVADVCTPSARLAAANEGLLLFLRHRRIRIYAAIRAAAAREADGGGEGDDGDDAGGHEPDLMAPPAPTAAGGAGAGAGAGAVGGTGAAAGGRGGKVDATAFSVAQEAYAASLRRLTLHHLYPLAFAVDTAILRLLYATKRYHALDRLVLTRAQALDTLDTALFLRSRELYHSEALLYLGRGMVAEALREWREQSRAADEIGKLGPTSAATSPKTTATSTGGGGAGGSGGWWDGRVLLEYVVRSDMGFIKAARRGAGPRPRVDSLSDDEADAAGVEIPPASAGVTAAAVAAAEVRQAIAPPSMSGLGLTVPASAIQLRPQPAPGSRVGDGDDGDDDVAALSAAADAAVAEDEASAADATSFGTILYAGPGGHRLSSSLQSRIDAVRRYPPSFFLANAVARDTGSIPGRAHVDAVWYDGVLDAIEYLRRESDSRIIFANAEWLLLVAPAQALRIFTAPLLPSDARHGGGGGGSVGPSHTDPDQVLAYLAKPVFVEAAHRSPISSVTRLYLEHLVYDRHIAIGRYHSALAREYVASIRRYDETSARIFSPGPPGDEGGAAGGRSRAAAAVAALAAFDLRPGADGLFDAGVIIGRPSSVRLPPEEAEELFRVSRGLGGTHRQRPKPGQEGGYLGESRARLIHLLQDSPLVDASEMLSVLASLSLHEERVVLHARLGHHHEALSLLVEELADHDAAVRYCLLTSRIMGAGAASAWVRPRDGADDGDGSTIAHAARKSGLLEGKRHSGDEDAATKGAPASGGSAPGGGDSAAAGAPAGRGDASDTAGADGVELDVDDPFIVLLGLYLRADDTWQDRLELYHGAPGGGSGGSGAGDGSGGWHTAYLDLALDLLASHAQAIDPVQVARLLPDTLPLHKVADFWSVVLPSTTHTRNEAAVVRGLYRDTNIAAQDALVASQSRFTFMTRTTHCVVCDKRIGDSVFATLPGVRPQPVHFKCLAELGNTYGAAVGRVDAEYGARQLGYAPSCFAAAPAPTLLPEPVNASSGVGVDQRAMLQLLVSRASPGYLPLYEVDAHADARRYVTFLDDSAGGGLAAGTGGGAKGAARMARARSTRRWGRGTGDADMAAGRTIDPATVSFYRDLRLGNAATASALAASGGAAGHGASGYAGGGVTGLLGAAAAVPIGVAGAGVRVLTGGVTTVVAGAAAAGGAGVAAVAGALETISAGIGSGTREVGGAIGGAVSGLARTVRGSVAPGAGSGGGFGGR